MKLSESIWPERGFVHLRNKKETEIEREKQKERN